MCFREDLKARVAWGGCSKSCSGDTEVVLVGVVICRFSQAMGNGKPLQNFEIVTQLKFYLKKSSPSCCRVWLRGREPLQTWIWDAGSESEEK